MIDRYLYHRFPYSCARGSQIDTASIARMVYRCVVNVMAEPTTSGLGIRMLSVKHDSTVFGLDWLTRILYRRRNERSCRLKRCTALHGILAGRLESITACHVKEFSRTRRLEAEGPASLSTLYGWSITPKMPPRAACVQIAYVFLFHYERSGCYSSLFLLAYPPTHVF